MARKLTVLLFIVALFVFTLYPGQELSIDVVHQSALGSANSAVQSSETEPALKQDSAQAPRYTPVPTPTPLPTPAPTPTPTPTPEPTPTPIPTPTPVPLSKGMSGESVKSLQNQLIRLGFMEGEADGVYGSGTSEAVQNCKTYINDQYIANFNGTAYFDSETAPAEAGTNGVADKPIEGTPAAPTPTPSIPVPFPMVNGDADAQLMDILNSGEIDSAYVTQTEGDQNSTVLRIQSRLESLGYIFKGVDGAFGASTKSGLMEFQRVNNLAQTGIADKSTQEALFSSGALSNDRPLHDYKIVVDISEQRVYAYQWFDGSYSKLVRKMKCSSGAKKTPTPLGTFDETVRIGARWHHFKAYGNCWAQYAIHIDPTGNVMFHSVLFSGKSEKKLTKSSVYALGRRASHGCVRLAVKDAQWMYEHVTDGTTVVIQK